MNTRQDTSATFKSHVNLVLVPVVARDVHGNAVGNLTKENFLLYDKGKPQEITRFALEKVGSKSLEADAVPVDDTPGQPEYRAGEKATTVVVPERYVAYLFDDVHINVSDIQRLRDAALRQIATHEAKRSRGNLHNVGLPAGGFHRRSGPAEGRHPAATAEYHGRGGRDGWRHGHGRGSYYFAHRSTSSSR